MGSTGAMTSSFNQPGGFDPSNVSVSGYTGAPSAAGVSNFAMQPQGGGGGLGGWAQNPYVQAGGAGLGLLGSIYGYIQNMQRDKAAAAQAKALGDPAALLKGFPTDPAITDPINRAMNANWAVRAGGSSGGALNQFAADAWAPYVLEYMRNQIAAKTASGGMYQRQPTQSTNQIGNILGQLQVLGRIGQPGQGGPVVPEQAPNRGFDTGGIIAQPYSPGYAYGDLY